MEHNLEDLNASKTQPLRSLTIYYLPFWRTTISFLEIPILAQSTIK